MNTIIAVDFDGTVVDHIYPDIGKPVPLALEWLKKLQDLNFKIILLTMRSDQYLQDAVDYLETNSIKLYGINQNPDQSFWTNSNKVYADYYIDDAAIGCPLLELTNFNRKCVDWEKIGFFLTKGNLL